MTKSASHAGAHEKAPSSQGLKLQGLLGRFWGSRAVFALILTLVFLIFGIFFINRHELTLSEGRAWGLAQEISPENFGELSQAEGQLLIGPLLTAPLAQIGVSYQAMEALSLGISAILVFLICFFAPFGRPVKLIFTLFSGLWYYGMLFLASASLPLISEFRLCAYPDFSAAVNTALFGCAAPLLELGFIITALYLLTGHRKLFAGFVICNVLFVLYLMAAIAGGYEVPTVVAAGFFWLILIFCWLARKFPGRRLKGLYKFFGRVELLRLWRTRFAAGSLCFFTILCSVPYALASGFTDLGFLERPEVATILNTFPENTVLIVSDPDYLEPLAAYAPYLTGGREIYDLSRGETLHYWKGAGEEVEEERLYSALSAFGDRNVLYLTYLNTCGTGTVDGITFDRATWTPDGPSVPLTIHSLNKDSELKEYDIALTAYRISVK